jgi:hypothetical protein
MYLDRIFSFFKSFWRYGTERLSFAKNYCLPQSCSWSTQKIGTVNAHGYNFKGVERDIFLWIRLTSIYIQNDLQTEWRCSLKIIVPLYFHLRTSLPFHPPIPSFPIEPHLQPKTPPNIPKSHSASPAFQPYAMTNTQQLLSSPRLICRFSRTW